MRKFVLTTAALLLMGTATQASSYADAITQAYQAAGYSKIEVTRAGGQWFVIAQMNGTPVKFVVDPSTGRSHRASDDGAGHDVGDDHGNDGAGHDVGDDHGNDGAGHDVGDDHGNDGVGHDVGDDHGNDGVGHDVGDDHGNDGAGHDVGDDHGGGRDDDRGGDDHGSDD